MSISPQTLVRAWSTLVAIWVAISLYPTQVIGQDTKNVKWEYCDLTRVVNQQTNAVQYALTKGKEKIEATSLKELGEKLKMKDAPAFTLAVLDYLGEHGWELVSYTAVNNAPPLTTEVYMLKRRR